MSFVSFVSSCLSCLRSLVRFVRFVRFVGCVGCVRFLARVRFVGFVRFVHSCASWLLFLLRLPSVVHPLREDHAGRELAAPGRARASRCASARSLPRRTDRAAAACLTGLRPTPCSASGEPPSRHRGAPDREDRLAAATHVVERSRDDVRVEVAVRDVSPDGVVEPARSNRRRKSRIKSASRSNGTIMSAAVFSIRAIECALAPGRRAALTASRNRLAQGEQLRRAPGSSGTAIVTVEDAARVERAAERASGVSGRWPSARAI